MPTYIAKGLDFSTPQVTWPYGFMRFRAKRGVGGWMDIQDYQRICVAKKMKNGRGGECNPHKVPDIEWSYWLDHIACRTQFVDLTPEIAKKCPSVTPFEHLLGKILPIFVQYEWIPCADMSITYKILPNSNNYRFKILRQPFKRMATSSSTCWRLSLATPPIELRK